MVSTSPEGHHLRRGDITLDLIGGAGASSAINSIVWRLPHSVTTVVGANFWGRGQLDVTLFLATLFYVMAITLLHTNFAVSSPVNRRAKTYYP